MAENDGSKKLALKLDYRVISVVLFIAIVGMLAVWRPWSGTSSSQRKIQVTGQATIKAEPDEFIFSPSYTSKNPDKMKAAEELGVKATEITKKIKEFGVTDKDIKSSTGLYPMYYPEKIGDAATATLSMTITVTKKDIVQKVQDYLVSTSPSGQISPYATFSESKQKELQTQGREKAIEDAKKQVEQTAKNLDVKIGKVLEVSDGSGFSVRPMIDGAVSSTAVPDKAVSLPVQPGESEYPFSVTVTFALR